MKKYLIALLFIFFLSESKAQIKLNDFGRIVLNTHLPESMKIPGGAKDLLKNKLSQITSNNGLGGSKANPRFIITARVNIGTKDIIPGPPQMIAQNIELILYIGDKYTNQTFSNTSLSIKGVGTNQDKAFINAFKKINPKNKNILSFLKEGKNKIINFFNTECDFILKKAQSLAEQEKYDEAIYRLSQVPEVSKVCYYKSLESLALIYQQKIDVDCNIKLNEAQITWAAAQNVDGALKAGEILSTIKPNASCQNDVSALIQKIDDKLKADEKKRWKFKIKQYEDRVEAQREQTRIAEEKSIRDDKYRENQAQRNNQLDKIRINAYREIAVEYAKNNLQ